MKDTDPISKDDQTYLQINEAQRSMGQVSLNWYKQIDVDIEKEKIIITESDKCSRHEGKSI